MALETGLVFGGLLGFGAAALYGFVGQRLIDRAQSEQEDADARLALRLFAVWWIAIAGSTVVTSLATLLAGLHVLDLALHVTARYVNIIFICVGLWGLLYYLLYLFTGRRGIMAPLTAFYVAYGAVLLYAITAAQPVALELGPWRATLVDENPIEGGFYALLIMLLILPQIVGAAAYLSLAFRFREPTLRWRVGLVASGLLLWFGGILAGAMVGLNAQEWWHFVTRFLGLTAAIMVFLAYHPPAWAQDLGVMPTGAKTTW